MGVRAPLTITELVTEAPLSGGFVDSYDGVEQGRGGAPRGTGRDA
ncbi:hypothetical protein GCM10010166_01490 [Couchioplanes caeruleus subsp. azureus]|nr:hypothetical protein GCM10010166_01490 [Couchioplanes caeruleus subsp. azureus]